MNINLFNIDTVGKSENILILKGSRINNTRFTIYISRSINNNKKHIDQLQTYLYTCGTYYIISIDNFKSENELNLIWEWEHIDPSIKEFPFHMYGIHPSAYFYIKGLILT
jgi:hypothetical protein